MARAFLVALWCATAATASASRYGDYSGARMPAYGAPDYDAREPSPAHEPEDYRGHSPDAPAALDYKYEEELAGALVGKKEHLPPVKEDKKEMEETDSWQRPSRRQRKKKSSRTTAEPISDSHDRFDPENDFPKTRTSNRFITKHRLRIKSRRFESDEDEQGYPSHRDKHADSDMQDNEEAVKEDYRNEKRNNMDEKGRYSRGERVVRRKPRDKIDRGLDLEERSDREDISNKESDVDRWMMMRGGLGRPPGPVPFPDVEEDREMRRRPDVPIREPSKSEEDEEAPIKRIKSKGKKEEEYTDYYDMKRVMNIKNKLPSMLRRTTVWGEVSVPAIVPAIVPTTTTSTTTEPTVTPGVSQPLRNMLANRRVFLPPAHEPRSGPTSPQPLDVIPLSGPTHTSYPTTLLHIATDTNLTRRKELSLAEKSRLSIMKKALRKEALDGGLTTKKPPVLLQVKDKLPTVVMVEPPSSEPFLRARAIYADSPARVDAVKRLMRSKLVASAKNIHDLTDNWDDLVCDYVDMSLVENINTAVKFTDSVLLIVPVIIFIRQVGDSF